MVNVIKKTAYVLAWVLWLAFCYLLAQILILVPFRYLPDDFSVNNTFMSFAISALVYILASILLVGGPWMMRKRLKISEKVTEFIGLTRAIKLADFKKAIGAYLLYMLVLIGVMLAFAFFFPELSNQEQSLGFDKTGNNLWQLGLIFISLVIISPVFEELIMRGVLFGRLRLKISFWPVALITSILFAIAHGQINVAIDTFILSLFLCGLREKTGTIWAPIIVHMLKNFLGFLLVFVVVV